MEIQAIVKKKKELYTHILSFLESEDYSEDIFQIITKIIDDQEIIKNRYSFLEIFHLLYSIGDNHNHTANLFNGIGLILQYLTKNKPLPISNTEILDIFRRNKRLLFLLLEYKIIIPDISFVKDLMKSIDLSGYKMHLYMYPAIKNFFGKNIEKEITQKYNVSIETFESKIKEGGNDLPICKLIRHDSIQEFVSYVNSTGISLQSTIKPDFYESNTFLIVIEPSLIEYAFYYGSIQVIKYLLNKHVTLPPNIWLYAVHSNNPELIEFLIENKINPRNSSYEDCLKESIKCHHNEVADYIQYNLLDDTFFNDDISYYITKYNNYYYYPDDIESMINKKIQVNSLTSSLTQITIPSSVTTIKDVIFKGCSTLTHINFETPASLKIIQKFAFSECSSLTNITIPSSVTIIDDWAFFKCSSLTQISIPSSVTDIGESTFEGCVSLMKVTFETPSFIEKFHNYLFKGCSSLTEISIPSSVKSIGIFVFDGCSSLKQISNPSSIFIPHCSLNGCPFLEHLKS